MSFEDVIPILKQLNGKGIDASELGDSWTGGLGFYGVDYFTGPSEVDLHMVNDVNTVCLDGKIREVCLHAFRELCPSGVRTNGSEMLCGITDELAQTPWR